MDISQGPGRMIFLGVMFVLMASALYFLNIWLNGSGDVQDYILYTSPNAGLKATDTTAKSFSSANVPGLYAGGDYSVSTWIYVTDWSKKSGLNKPFLTLSGGSSGAPSFKTMVMYLGAHVNKLGIRISNDASPTQYKITTGTSSQMTDLVAASGIYSDASVNTKCDISSINLQKWVNITVVMSGTTVDVYIDGKLSRSCILDGIYLVDGDTPTLTLGGPDGFGGLIGQTRAANYAYAPDQVYKYYLAGPFDTSIWGYLSRIFGSFSIDVKAKVDIGN